MAEVKAYQTDPPFDPDAGEALSAEEEVLLADSAIVDLAAGDEMAEPIQFAEVSAPSGRYNALSFKYARATDGPTAGQVLVLEGTATKDGQTIPFTLQFDREYAYQCGDFVGDERKGILEPGSQAELEATFHFDHLFGDGGAPADDAINTGALGFDPLAALAEGDAVTADLSKLEAELSAEDFATLEKALSGLAHVGEGHCELMSS